MMTIFWMKGRMTRIRIRQISSDVDPLPLYLTIMERAEVPPLVLEVMCPPVPDYHGEGWGAPLGPGGDVGPVGEEEAGAVGVLVQGGNVQGGVTEGVLIIIVIIIIIIIIIIFIIISIIIIIITIVIIINIIFIFIIIHIIIIVIVVTIIIIIIII